MRIRLAFFLLLIAPRVGAFAVDDHPPTLAIGTQAPDFALPGVDGRTYQLGDFSGSQGNIESASADHPVDGRADY